jgi:hypothetical protein
LYDASRIKTEKMGTLIKTLKLKSLMNYVEFFSLFDDVTGFCHVESLKSIDIQISIVNDIQMLINPAFNVKHISIKTKTKGFKKTLASLFIAATIIFAFF